MKSENCKTKKFAGACRSVIRLFFILGFITLFVAGCDMADEKKLNLGYKIYIPNMSDSTITVMPKKESDKTTLIDLDKNPIFISQKPDSNKLYCLLEGTNQITVVDTSDDTVDETFRFEVGSSGVQENLRIKFTSNGKKAYLITGYQPAGIAVMDTSDNSFVTGINVDSTTIDMMYLSSTGSRLYCTDSNEQKIYSINTGSEELVETIDVPEAFSKTLFDASSSLFYMAEEGTNAGVKIYNKSKDEFTDRIDNVVSNIKLMKMSSDKKLLYVLGSEEMVTIKLSDFTIDDRISLDYRDPVDFRFLPDNSYIVVPSGVSDLMMIMKTNDYTTEDTIKTGNNPGEMVIKY